MPATLAVKLGAPATFGAFTPGVAREYTGSTTATVTSSAGDATLTVSDPRSAATGHLVNGAFALPQPLQGLGTVKTWNGPTANETVTVPFKQAIAADDALRTGAYSKTSRSRSRRRRRKREPPARVAGDLQSPATPDHPIKEQR